MNWYSCLTRFEVVAQNRLPIVDVDELQIDANQILVCRDEIQAFHLGLADGVSDLLAVHEDVVNRRHSVGLLDSETAGRVSLRIAVDQEDLDFARGERGGEIDGGGCLTHAAFLVGDCDDSVKCRFESGCSVKPQSSMFHVKHSGKHPESLRRPALRPEFAPPGPKWRAERVSIALPPRAKCPESGRTSSFPGSRVYPNPAIRSICRRC